MNNRHIVLEQKSQEKQDKTFGIRLKSVQLNSDFSISVGSCISTSKNMMFFFLYTWTGKRDNLTHLEGKILLSHASDKQKPNSARPL